MHTLSVFPVLFDFQMIGALLLRVSLGGMLVALVWHEKGGAKNFSLGSLHGFTKIHVAELVIALFLIVGLYTQVVTILAAAAIIIRWNNREKGAVTDGFLRPDTFYENALYIALLVVAASLLVLGAGFLAFDLPL